MEFNESFKEMEIIMTLFNFQELIIPKLSPNDGFKIMKILEKYNYVVETRRKIK